MRQLILLAIAALACGFSAGAQFDLDPVASDGAGGIAFDGSPRWTSHTCAVCHTNAPGLISIRLEADHPELFTTGWTASMQYHLRVVMDGETEGLAFKASGDNCGFSTTPYAACDLNGFALEVDDVGGDARGSYQVVAGSDCATGSATVIGADAYILKDGTAAIYSGVHSGTTSWDVCWTAPASGAGTLTAYIAAVDGNGGSGSAFPNDPYGDDVAAGQVPLFEVGATAPQSGGCNAAGDRAGGIAVVLALAALALRRRRAAIVTLVLASSCVHVRPRERETLAKRAMKFSPDPAEDQVDLHMQEAREGSQGGYGTSGGGCGCN
ncbi:MAG TPA: DUF4266 domain-containing protein [Kofleriaceae bacterium]|nr:DUF4266 domain-containing protein [Kofleriaceae bacterium]